MPKQEQVIIYWKRIQFQVCLPEDKVWPFAMAFGKEFAKEDAIEGGMVYPTMDQYFIQGRGYHVLVSVHVSEEEKFYKFLRNFCQQHRLPVRESDLKPGHH